MYLGDVVPVLSGREEDQRSSFYDDGKIKIVLKKDDVSLLCPVAEIKRKELNSFLVKWYVTFL